MLVMVTLVATLLPAALAWRALRHRRRHAIPIAAALALAATLAGWRATSALTEGLIPITSAMLGLLLAGVIIIKTPRRRRMN